MFIMSNFFSVSFFLCYSQFFLTKLLTLGILFSTAAAAAAAGVVVVVVVVVVRILSFSILGQEICLPLSIWLGDFLFVF